MNGPLATVCKNQFNLLLTEEVSYSKKSLVHLSFLRARHSRAD